MGGLFCPHHDRGFAGTNSPVANQGVILGVGEGEDFFCFPLIIFCKQFQEAALNFTKKRNPIFLVVHNHTIYSTQSISN